MRFFGLRFTIVAQSDALKMYVSRVERRTVPGVDIGNRENISLTVLFGRPGTRYQKCMSSSLDRGHTE